MKKIAICLTAVLMMVACTPNREKQLKAIEKQKAELSALDYITEDTDITEILKLYRTFAADFPNDSLAPQFLMDAADISCSVGRYGEALALLDTVINFYPGFEDMGGCWFLKGLAFENMGEMDSARAVYSHFVDNYPEHPLARDTRFQLENNLVGLSAEDQLEMVLALTQEP